MVKNSSNVKITWQLTTMVASLIYIAVMTHGYFNMFISTIGSVFFTITVAVSITLFAWLLAKLVAINGGIKNAVPLFIPLVLVSAAGIFNSMMLNTQGETIFREAVDEASLSFSALDQVARNNLKVDEFENIVARVGNLETAFIQELRNPNNCGQGVAANRIFTELRSILPTLTLLSGSRDCDNIERVIPLYQKQINDALLTHPLMLRNAGIYEARDQVRALSERAAADRLRALNVIESGDNLIINAKPILERISRDYKSSVNLLRNNLSHEKTMHLKSDLDFDSVRSLGDVAKFPKLIVSRLNDFLMYFIILLAIGVDWLLVYLMRRTRDLDVHTKPDIPAPSNVRNGLDF